MGILERLLGRKRDEALPLYRAVVARARHPHWYIDGAVADTIDGRFDMVAAILSVVLMRLEAEPAGAAPAAWLAERFVDDMDGQMREIGIGDVVVGKQIGKLMGMLGGRLGAYRAGFGAGDPGPALVRNLYRGHAPAPAALAHVATGLADLDARLRGVTVAAMMEGTLP